MEIRKSARACFIAGVLCVAAGLGLAIAFTPDFWWLGILAGFAGGYLSYEFREVLRAIPLAWRWARREGAHAGYGILAAARGWLVSPHPFFYSAAVAVTPFFLLVVVPYILAGPFILAGFTEGLLPVGVTLVVLLPVAFVELTWLLMLPFLTLSFIGARIVERCYWVPTSSADDQQEWFREMQKKGYREMPLTYRNAFRWAAKGSVATLCFFVWTLWKYLAIGAWATLCFLGRFVWYLLKLIHSEERVLCALDGTLGGAIVTFWFRNAQISFAEYLVLVFFGGLLGAAIGIPHAKLARRLHLVPSR